MAKLPEVVVVERDARIWELRKSGLTPRQIAKALNVSESTAYRACKRTSDRIIKQLAIDHGQEILLDLHRIDNMIASFLPLTRPKKIETPDGEEVEIPPSSDAANTVLKLMTHRMKLLGLEQNAGTEINITTNNIGSMPVFNTSREDKVEVEKTPEQEARHLLEVMKEAGVIDEQELQQLVASNAVIIDAEVVEDSEGEVEEVEVIEEEPPPFEDSYDEEDDSWRFEDG